MGLGSLEWGGEECVLIELNQMLTSTGGGRVVDLGCRRFLQSGLGCGVSPNNSFLIWTNIVHFKNEYWVN